MFVNIEKILKHVMDLKTDYITMKLFNFIDSLQSDILN